jgi:hypothetical protein
MSLCGSVRFVPGDKNFAQGGTYEQVPPFYWAFGFCRRISRADHDRCRLAAVLGYGWR